MKFWQSTARHMGKPPEEAATTESTKSAAIAEASEPIKAISRSVSAAPKLAAAVRSDRTLWANRKKGTRP